MSVEDVRAAKDYVISKGVLQTTNEFPWLVTNLVAFRTDGMLIGKSAGQNHWAYQGQRYAIDAIAYPESNREVDCLINAGPPDNGNVPAWSTRTLQPAPYLLPINPVTIWPTGPPLPPVEPPTNGDIALILVRLGEAEARLLLLEGQHNGLVHRIEVEEQKPLPDYEGQGRVGWFGGSFTVRSKPVA